MAIRPPNTIPEIQAVLRDLDRRITSGAVQASVAASAVPSLDAVIEQNGGDAGRRERGKLVLSNKNGIWYAFPLDEDGFALLADSTEELGVRWGLVGEVMINLRCADGPEDF